MFKRFKVTGINENPKKPKRNLMKYLVLGCVMALPAFALLKTGVLSMHKNVLAADQNKYDIVADLDGGKFEMGTTPEFAKMDNGNWLYKYKPVPTPTKLPAPVKDGYDFIGWTVSAKPDIQKEYSIPVWHKGNLNVKANWKSKDAILMSGPTFNSTIEQIPGFANVTEIRFVKGTPNQSGVSVAAEGDIKAHISGNILTIASEKEIFANPDSSTMFKGFGLSYETNKLLNSILFNNFNASKVTDMCGMFSGCQKLTSLDLSSFNTSNVTDMSSMFNGCSALTSLNMDNFNTSKVTTMYGMFYQCSQLPNIDVTSFNTENVTNMYYMFRECKKLQSVDVSKFNTSKVTNMHGMFYWCYELSNIIGLEKFNTSRVTNMGFMFDQCYVLQKVDVSNWDTSKARNMNEMFESCKKLSGSITVGNPNLTNHYTTFTRCSTDPNAKFYVKFKDDATKEVARKMVATKSSDSNVFLYETSTLIDGKTFNKELQRLFSVSNDVDPRIVYFMNSADLSSTSIPTNATDVSAAKDGTIKMFAEYYSPGLDPKAASYSKVFIVSDKIIEANPDSSKMFYNPPDHEGEHCDIYKIYFNNLDTSKVTDMSYMFANMGTSTGTPILHGIENFDTSKVTNTSHMFYRCADLVGNMIIRNSTISQYDNMFFNTSTSGKFIVKYTSSETRKVAEKMVATKSPNSHVYLDGTQPATLMAGTQFRTTLKEMSGFENVTEIRFVKGTPNTNGVNVAIEGEAKAHIEGSILTIASKGEIFANKDCSWMFYDLKKLNKIIFDNFDTSNVIDMTRMFDACNSLTSLDLSNFNTSKVTDMSFMFVSCNSLTSLDLSNFNTSKVTSMSSMFGGCNSLTSLDLSNFDTSRVDMMSYMFENDNLLTNIKGLENFDTSRVYYIAGLFNGCSKLSGQITIMNADIPSVYIMFKNCSTDSNSKFIVKYTNDTTKALAKNMVATKSTNSNVYLDGTQPATLMSGGQFNSTIKKMNGFSNVTEIRFIKGTPNPNGTNVAIEGEAKAYIEGNVLTVASEKTIFANEDCDRMFYDCSSLTSIDVSNFDTSKVTTMYKMFNYCEKLTSIDVSNFNTSKVTNMWGMFSECYSLTSIKGLENFNTSQVTSMNNMFSSCRSLTSLDASNFDTSQVTIMYYMFNSCRLLTSIKGLENFDTSKVTNMNNMFNSCGKLSGEITISNPNITEYSYMFTNSSTDSSAKFVVNYTSGCQSVAKAMVATKDSGSTVGNVVLGTQKSLLSEDTPNDEEPSVPDTVILTIKDGNTVTTKEILAGEIGSLNTPSKEGMVFSGYFYNAEFTKPVSERDVISEDTTIYIKWGKNSVFNMLKSTFNPNKVYNNLAKPAPTSYAAAHQNTKPVAITRQIDITLNNGSMAMYPVQKIQVNSGKIGDLAKPDLNPKYAGQFGGYFYDKRCTIPVKPNDVVTQDIELYAKW